MNDPLRIVLVAVLLAAAGTLGYGAYRWYYAAQSPVASVPLPVSVPASEPAGPPPGELPAMRPVFSLQDRDGKLRSITDWDGKSLVINFWATWCPPCRREIPMLMQLYAARAAQGIEVIGVAVDFREDVLAFADKIGIDYPLLIGEQDGLDAAARFGLGTVAFPFTVFTDRQGRIVTAHLGELHANEADAILDAVVAINAGTLTLEQAKKLIAAELKKESGQSS